MEENKKFPKIIIKIDKVNFKGLNEKGNLLFFGIKLKEEQSYNTTHSVYQCIDGKKNYCGSFKCAEEINNIKFSIHPDKLINSTEEYKGKKFVPLNFGWKENSIRYYNRERKESIIVGRYQLVDWRRLQDYNIVTTSD